MTEAIKKNYEKLEELEKKCATLPSEEALQLRNTVASEIRQSGKLTVKTDIVNFFKKIGGGAEGRMIEQYDHLRSIMDTQVLLAQRDMKVVEYYRALRDVAKVATISRVQDTMMLMVKE